MRELQKCYVPAVEIKNYNVMIDGRNFFDLAIKKLRTFHDIRKIATGQGDGYTTGCVLDYSNFN